MSSRRNRFVIVGAAALIVLAILAIVVVPRLADINRYRSRVVAYLESKTGKPARVGRLELTLFPHLAIQIDNFVMENPEGFPTGDFFRAQRIYALLEAHPLLSKRIVIRSLIVEEPVFHLISNTEGRWNFENPPESGGNSAGASASREPGFSLGTISEVRIDQGQVTIANLLRSGEIGPTYFDGRGLACQVQDVNIEALAAPSSGPEASGSSQIIPAAENHSTPVARGSFHADSLRFGAIQVTSLDSRIQAFPRQAYLDDLTLKLAGGAVRGQAASDFSQRDLVYKVQTQFQNINVARLL